MTSKGIGDVRRVMGQPQSWADQTFGKPAPPFPDPLGDPLVAFVVWQVGGWERQVVTEAVEYRQRPLGPAMVRYAMDIHHMCAAIRKLLARYGELRDSSSPDAVAVRAVISDLSSAWSRHPDWHETWPPSTPTGDSGDS